MGDGKLPESYTWYITYSSRSLMYVVSEVLVRVDLGQKGDVLAFDRTLKSRISPGPFVRFRWIIDSTMRGYSMRSSWSEVGTIGIACTIGGWLYGGSQSYSSSASYEHLEHLEYI